MSFKVTDWIPTLSDIKRTPAILVIDKAITAVVSLMGGWLAADYVDPVSRLGFVVVLLCVAFSLAVIWGVIGRATREWRKESAPNKGTNENAELIDPFLSTDQRTYARVLIDTNNWRAEVLRRSNVYEVKARLLDADKTAVQLVIIFDRWTFERGARIQADNRSDTYRTSEDAMTERYAIYTVSGIKAPCIIDIEFQPATPSDEPSDIQSPPSSE